MRLNLNTEVGWPDFENDTFWDLAISGHAPASTGGLPLNIAATDDEFRRISIAELVGYVEQVRRLPRLKQVNIHPPPRQWLDETQTAVRQSDYGLMIDSIRQIADFTAKIGLDLVLENLIVCWPRAGVMSREERFARRIDDPSIPVDLPIDEVDWTDANVWFGVSPEEWFQICEDVDRENVGLCLDSSHACTYAHTFAPERRAEAMMAFVARPELIRHVHWSDSFLDDSLGRADRHMLIGKGTLPVEFHRAIKGLDATLLIENFFTVEDLEEELEYIARL
jgi:sugar phosphate isomerase/epimerase